MLKRSLKFFLFALMLVAAATMFGCGSDGSDGAQGPAGPTGPQGPEGPPGTTIEATAPEQCAICHKNVDQVVHQEIYNMYKDDSTLELTITSVTSEPGTVDGTFDATMTFTITQNDVPFTDGDGLPSLDQKRFYTVTYDPETSTFDNSVSFSGIVATANDGEYQAFAEGMSYQPELSVGQAYGYIAADPLDVEVIHESHIDLFNDVSNAALTLPVDGTATYDSPANVAGCQKCHGTPYLKHGYRAAEVTGSLGDFSACKACHYDSRPGGHEDWQILVTDPARFAELFEDPDLDLTDEEEIQFAYTANVMNDVHMSHSMEFGYPQSMANCATCHEGNLEDDVLIDENFTATTCKSCHPVETTVEEEFEVPPFVVNPIHSHAAPSLKFLWERVTPPGFHNIDSTCTSCHSVEANVADLFSELMPGYDDRIYDVDTKTKYSEIFTVTIDGASFENNILNIQFSSQETADGPATGLSKNNIEPHLLVGLYAYGTKDYLVGPHRRDIDDQRNLEASVGDNNPRVTVVSAGPGSWTATADLSAWANEIADGKIKRAEIAVQPYLPNPDLGVDGRNNVIGVALDAPSRTFDLTTNAFDPIFFADIVDVKGDINFGTLEEPVIDESGSCNSCHDALGPTFHGGQYGGNIKLCRLCHDSLDDGSHLEMQSRAIESYVHAIHTFQGFDIQNVDFTDQVERVAHEVHNEHFFPRFTRKACEACHVSIEGTVDSRYQVSDQAKSLTGRLSRSRTAELDNNPSLVRNIGFVPSYVTGPGYRACGGCHRAEEIKEDDAGKLVSLNAHASTNGYLIAVQDADEDFGFPDAEAVLIEVIDLIQSFFSTE